MDIKILSKRQGGKLYHYSHFIRDFLLPFFHYTINNNISIEKVFMNKLEQQSCGTFFNKLHEFFGYEFILLNANKWRGLKLTSIHIECPCFAPILNETYQKLITYIENKFDLQKNTYITLIERKEEKLAFDAPNGISRRTIVNFHNLAKTLSVLPNFRVVSLEGKSLTEQIQLFYESRIIIGQHGGALVNSIFTKNAMIIEISAEYGNPAHWYSVIHSYKKDMKWCRYVFPGDKHALYVPENKLLFEIQKMI